MFVNHWQGCFAVLDIAGAKSHGTSLQMAEVRITCPTGSVCVEFKPNNLTFVITIRNTNIYIFF